MFKNDLDYPVTGYRVTTSMFPRVMTIVIVPTHRNLNYQKFGIEMCLVFESSVF